MEFFAATGIVFWIVAAIGFLTIMVSVDYEAFGFTTLAFVITVALLLWLGHAHPIDWALAHRNEIILAVVAYFVVGIVWGIVKWFFHLMSIRDKLVEYRRNNNIKSEGLSVEQISDFKSLNRLYEDIPPKAFKSKHRILFWMAYWPFSMPWTLVNEPVKRFFSFVYRRLAGMLQGMSDRLFKNLV